MLSISLLFDRTHLLLGEIESRGGSLAQATLTQRGEQALGPYLQEWQTRGVPRIREITTRQTELTERAFFLERVQPRQPQFLQAVRAWIERYGMALVTLPKDAVKCWERILKLPLEPRERFVLVVALRGVQPDALVAWQEALDEAMRTFADDRRATEAAVGKLWQQAATQLSHSLAKA